MINKAAAKTSSTGAAFNAPVAAQGSEAPCAVLSACPRHAPLWPLLKAGVALFVAASTLIACDSGSAAFDTSQNDADTFSCTPSQVWDGDTFTCSDGRKVRVAGIAAREIKMRKVSGEWTAEDAGCREGHPCPTISGTASRKALARFLDGNNQHAFAFGRHGHFLVEGPNLQCTNYGTTGDRQAAWCSSPVVGDLSCAMVQGGYALRWERYWRDHRC